MPLPERQTQEKKLWSHARTVDRFDSAEVAGKYPAAYGNSFRERREQACLLRALRQIPSGNDVLDLPCGAGRLTPLLVEAGMRVTGADSSPHMVQQANENWRKLRVDSSGADDSVRFEVRDALNTGYADRQFDAVFCNRLFHHFNESETRVKALRELRRITRGTIVVSFFNSFALDAVRFRLKHWMRGTEPQDRIPIPMHLFAADVHRAGLKITSAFPVMWGLSPMWYVLASPRDAGTQDAKTQTRAA